MLILFYSPTSGIFTPGEDVAIAMEHIESMRSCYKKIKDSVMFQLVMTLSHPPMHNDLAYYIKKAKSHPRICGGHQEDRNKKSVKNYANKRV